MTALSSPVSLEIYKAAHGPWEVHQTCDDLYFARMGTARAKLDGALTGGKEDPPGEIRGTGVPRTLWIPARVRLGYLLVKVCD